MENIECENCPSKSKGVFCQLTSNELKDVSKYKITNTYKKGQNLFVEGSPTYGLYCVSSGNIKLTKTSSNGKDSIIRIAQGGDVIGHRSLFTKKFYNLTATAIEDTKVCFLDKQFITKIIAEKPSVAANIISKLSRDMGASESRVASFSQKTVRERLAELILILKESHGCPLPNGEGIKIDLKLKREEIASMIGTANETLIRLITEFKNEGHIGQDGKYLIVLNEESLIELSQLNY